MLALNSKQMTVIDGALAKTFVAEMVTRWRELSPAYCEAVGIHALHQAAQSGVERARAHGFTQRGPVRLFLELMLIFGSGFDNDPQHPWASTLLGANLRDPQTVRAKRLYQHVLAYEQRAFGPGGAYLSSALAKVSDVIARSEQIASGDLPSELLRNMIHVGFLWVSQLGANDQLDSIRRAAALAQRHLVLTRQGAVVLTALSATFGHECTSDPLVPWIGRLLGESSLRTPEHKIQKLAQDAPAWIGLRMSDVEAVRT